MSTQAHNAAVPADHNAVVRDSFTQQVGLFTGEHSPFARRFASPLAWVEPLDAGMIVLDVACGAGHAAEQAAPLVRQVVGIDITPALLAPRLRAGARRRPRQRVVPGGRRERRSRFSTTRSTWSSAVARCTTSRTRSARSREMARVCRPNGRVVVSDMVAPSHRSARAVRRVAPSHRSFARPRAAWSARSPN